MVCECYNLACYTCIAAGTKPGKIGRAGREANHLIPGSTAEVNPGIEKNPWLRKQKEEHAIQAGLLKTASHKRL